MTGAPVIAVYDANVLYPAPVRDLLIRLARAGLAGARWTDMIHDEWIRNLMKNRGDLSPEQLLRTRRMMDEAVPGATARAQRAALRNPPLSIEQYLDNLRRVGMRGTADSLQAAASEL